MQDNYIEKSKIKIQDTLLKFECQPILFIGSGISMRYFGAPTWRDLLKAMFEKLPQGRDLYEYNRQKYDDDPVSIGTALAEAMFEWAWSAGRAFFPQDMFVNTSKSDLFSKFMICNYLSAITDGINIDECKMKEEIDALSQIRPHAIITTNYDLFLEKVFYGYETITGQTIIKYNTNSFGEIFHIHGDVSDPKSIVITKNDYDNWIEKKKYVSAKLLTYFAEHPVFVLGYSLEDKNIKSILRDIGELVADESGLIDNVYQIIWHKEPILTQLPEQAVFNVEDQEFRTHAIHTNDLLWVLKALKSRAALTSINPKLVRALAARTMRLVRHDIPSGNVQVNYDVLERVATDGNELPKLLGITPIENTNQSHPFTLSQVAKNLKLRNWQAVHKIILEIMEKTGTDLRSSDNRYHCKIKTGTKDTSVTHKWSHEAVSLSDSMMRGSAINLHL